MSSGNKRPPLLQWSPETWKRWAQMRRMCTKAIPNTKFLLLKAPASTVYEGKFGGDAFMFTVAMFVERMISKNNLVGLAIDCTSIDCDAFDPDTADPSNKIKYFHNDSEWDEFDVDYVRLKPNSNAKDSNNEISDGIPEDKTVLEFFHHCITLWNTRPNAYIAVFDSRGGIGSGAYLAACFMAQKMKVPVNEAIAGIKETLEPGIFDEQLLRLLQKKFHGQKEIVVPQPPVWHVSGFEEDEDGDEDGEPNNKIVIPPYNGQTRKRIGSDAVDNQPKKRKTEEIQGLDPCPDGSPKFDRAISVLHQLTGSQVPAIFPGYEEYTMSKDVLKTELTVDYNVSWHPVGRRGLLLALNDGVFFIESNGPNQKINVFKAGGVFFPRPSDLTKPQHRTLIDGVLVHDKEPSSEGGAPKQTPRFLATDIIAHEGGIVKNKPLSQRLKFLLDGVYGARKRCSSYDFNKKECFRFRVRDVFEMRKTTFLLTTFTKQVTHPLDGVVFLPIGGPYFVTKDKNSRPEAGKRVLLWKRNGDISQEDLQSSVGVLVSQR